RPQPPPLVAEVEDVRDLLAWLEPELLERDHGASLSLLDLVGARVLRGRISPELTVEEERVEVGVVPAKRLAQELVQRVERVVRRQRQARSDSAMVYQPRVEDVRVGCHSGDPIQLRPTRPLGSPRGSVRT